MVRYIFGYGSLISASSRFQTLQAETPIVPVLLPGYKRVWNTQEMQLGGGITFLGLEQHPSSQCNGVIFPADEEQFARLQTRESGYKQFDIPLETFHLQAKASWIDSDSVTLFCNDSEKRPTPDCPIVQSYLDLCLAGCLEIEDQFSEIQPGQATRDFIEQTDGWSRHWINDRIHARRPWAYTPQASRIDKAIKAHLPEYVPHIQIQP